MQIRLFSLSALLLVACGDGGATPPVTSCEDAVPGPSGGTVTGRVTICALDETGAPVVGAAVDVGGVEAGVTDETGKLNADVSATDAVEVSAGGFVTHTLHGVASRRYGVVLARPTATTRTVSGTITGINALPPPPDTYRRVIEIRAGTPMAPYPLAREIAVGAPVDCTIAGDECTFSIELDSRATRVNATVVNTTSAFADRIVAAYAVSDPVTDGPTDFVIPEGAGMSEVALDAPATAVLSVGGARYGDEVMLFGSGSSLTAVAVPAPPISGTPWLAVIFDSAGDELVTGVLSQPPASTGAPAIPGVALTGSTLQLPSDRTATVSLMDGTAEVWRATVVDGRSELVLPTITADTVAVVLHGSSSNNTESGDLDGVEGVVQLPVVR